MPLSGGGPAAEVTIISAEAEAEAEAEVESEAEVQIEAASAAAGVSAAVAAVGADVFLSDTALPILGASETATSVSGASSTSTSVSSLGGGLDVTQFAADEDDNGAPVATGGTPAGETNDGPSSEDLQSDDRRDGNF